MVKVGKWIAKHKVLVLLMGCCCCIPVYDRNREDKGQLRPAQLSAGDTGDSEGAGYHGG